MLLKIHRNFVILFTSFPTLLILKNKGSMEITLVSGILIDTINTFNSIT